jgi:hypothetical protein
MKRVGMLLAVGLFVLGGSAVRAAGEGGGAPELLPAPAATAAPAESGCGAAGCAPAGCCAATACEGHGGGHFGHFRDWLMYHPPETRCPCHHGLTPCMPPLYTFFLDRCPGGGCGGCGAHHAPAP